ncbi:MAG: hypothetical protein KAH54_02475 [Candidatus Sabulitectum sp.]|nr:hypothetical protein [Candidatus Sabulitectum sp.]
MRNRWTVQTEKGDHSVQAVWGAVEEASGKRTTAVVLNTESKAAMVILASGMFYLSGPGMVKPVLFRVDSCNRAQLKNCMFVRAIETADMVRVMENSILREMRKLLELDMLEAAESSVMSDALQIAAS